jgi:hypothetical protein
MYLKRERERERETQFPLFEVCGDLVTIPKEEASKI